MLRICWCGQAGMCACMCVCVCKLNGLHEFVCVCVYVTKLNALNKFLGHVAPERVTQVEPGLPLRNTAKTQEKTEESAK